MGVGRTTLRELQNRMREAWIRVAMLLKMHPATGSQLPNNMRLQSAQAPERGESYRVRSLWLPKLCYSS
ncbi:hypothetical protein AKJ16_DCAP04435 [Drosera capensis]